MLTYWYYANQEMERFTSPQDEKLATCTLTDGMLKKVVAECASGVPPFKAFVPRFVAWDFANWNIPTNLLSVRIVEGKDHTDISVCDEVRIVFDDCEAKIICCRVIPHGFDAWTKISL